MNSIRHVLFLVLFAAIAVVAAGCGGTSEEASGSGGDGEKLSLVAYSTPREAYEQLTKEFAATPEGEGVGFSQSFGASGDQARAILAGLQADIAGFALEPDMTKLVDEGIVAEDWKTADDHEGLVTRSVTVFVVRKGNPKGIETWDDLTEEGVEVLNANPFTSGGARWNVMAAYGAQLEQGKSEEEALAYLESLYDNIVVQDKAAREALQTFTSGKGDVLLSYENEAITAQQAGEDLEYVIPDQTILIENPVAATVDAPASAQAFVDFLRTEPAQKVFAEKGYRSVLDEIVDEQKYPEPETLFTIEDLGGWESVMKEFFDPEQSVMQGIQEDLGVATG